MHHPKMVAFLALIGMGFSATAGYGWGSGNMAAWAEEKANKRPRPVAGGEKMPAKELTKTNLDALKDGTYTGSAPGYSGDITVEVVVKDKRIVGLKVLSQTETPGYYEQGAAVIQRVLDKGSLDVDTISGATYTSHAILEAAARALGQKGSGKTLPPVTNQPSGPAPAVAQKTFDNLKDGTWEGSATGYKSTITVAVDVENGKITQARLVSANEDEPYFSSALPLLARVVEAGGTAGVDTVSGATFSSSGLLNAVNDALGKASGQGSGLQQGVAPDTSKRLAELLEENEGLKAKLLGATPTDNFDPSTHTLTDGTYEAKAFGYADDIHVEVVVANGKMQSMRIVSHKETPEYWKIAEPIVDAINEKGTPFGVDTISGATFSTRAVLNATSKALKKAAGIEEAETADEGQIAKLKEEIERLKKAADADTAGAITGTIQDGTWEGSAMGYEGPVKVSVTTKGGKITSLYVEHNETPDYWPIAEPIVRTIEEKGTIDGVDTISGATFSSRAVLNATKKALMRATGTASKEEDTSSEAEAGGGRVDELEKENFRLIKELVELRKEVTSASKGPKGPAQDGTYKGEGYGYNPNTPIEVEITIEKEKITALRITKQSEDAPYFPLAEALLVPQILEKGTYLGVDTVSGATFSSKGILNATRKAYESSRGEAAAIDPAEFAALEAENARLHRDLEALEKKHTAQKNTITSFLEAAKDALHAGGENLLDTLEKLLDTFSQDIEKIETDETTA